MSDDVVAVTAEEERAAAKIEAKLDLLEAMDVVAKLETQLAAPEQRAAVAEVSLNKKWADIPNEELIRVYNERKRSSLGFLDQTELGENNYIPRGAAQHAHFRQRVVELERELEDTNAQKGTAERAAAAAEARLSDLRAWGKAVKLFFSALKDADASARAALCKDPEGEIEKLMEGQTVEEATGEQALATIH